MAWDSSTLRDVPKLVEVVKAERNNLDLSSTREPRTQRSSPASTLRSQAEATHLYKVSSRRNSIQALHKAIQTTPWRGHVAMVAGIFQQSLCWGMIMTFGTILAYYNKHLLRGVSMTKLALVGNIPPFIVLALSLIWGRLLDAGHHRKVNILAGFCVTAGLLGLSYTGGNGGDGEGKYWAILLAAIPVGIGQSGYFLAAPHMAKTWYPNHKGFAMGITNSGAAIGGVAWPFIFNVLTAKAAFKAGVGSLAGISGLLAFFIAWAATPAPSFERRPMQDSKKIGTWIPFRAFRSRTFQVHIAAMCCIYTGILAIPFFIEVWAQKYHLGIAEDRTYGVGVDFDGDTDETFYLVVAMNACQILGRWLGSSLCDRYRARNIHCVACLTTVTSIGTFWWLAPKTGSYTVACAFASLFGLTLGIMVSLPINDVQDILGTPRTRLLGQFAGTVYACVSPFLLMGAVVTGTLVDRFHVHAAGIWACVTFGLGAMLIILSLWMEDDTWKFESDSDPNDRRLSRMDAVFSADFEMGLGQGGKEEKVCHRSLEDVMVDAHY